MTSYTCPEGHSSSDSDYCDVCGSPIGGSSAGVAAGAASGAASAAGSSLDLDAPAPGDAGSAGSTPSEPAGPAGQVCPNCSTTGLPDALFCENCGYDFTTGQMPRPLQPPQSADSGPDAGAAGSSSPGAMVQPPPSDPAPQVPPAGQDTVEWVVEIWVDPDWHAAQDVDEACPSPGMPTVVPLRERSVLVGRTSTSRNIHPDVEVIGDTGVSRRHAQLTTDGRRWFVEDLASANGTYVGETGGPLPGQPITAGQRTEVPDDGRIYLGAWTRLVIRKALPSEV